MHRCNRIQASAQNFDSVKVLGNVEKVNKHQSGNVYSPDSLSPNIMAGTHGYGFGYILIVKRC